MYIEEENNYIKNRENYSFFKLVPNTVVGTKTFTTTNKGDDTVEDYLVYFENVNNSLLRPEDLVYTV